jgi:hypothetical protein
MLHGERKGNAGSRCKPPTERAAGQKKERSGLQSACDELTDKGAFITDE